MALAPTPCLEAGCPGKATRQGRCQEHQTPWAGSTRKSRLPSDWGTRRDIVLRRDKSICWLCGQPGADTVDHKQQGDNHDLSNLAPVHDRVAPHCHRYKSSKEGNDTQRGNRIVPRT